MPHDPAEWKPVGVPDLEPAAWDALRHAGNAVVIAGPGAGKTEFLAQRACYLLETGICPFPRRILAISFKTDAAKNLRQRVRTRVQGPGRRRFDSMTFDAFTKSLVDRFVRALPPAFGLSSGYQVLFPKQKLYEDFLGSLAPPLEWAADVAAIPRQTFEAVAVGGYRLPVAGVDVVDAVTYAIERWWAMCLPPGSEAGLTFTNLNRLAELIVRTTPQVRIALQSTYPFVFIDECQDTTVAQLDFLTSLFSATDTVVTAVGDYRQRIMGWAGAVVDAAAIFEDVFGAEPFELILNHRSVPRLVDVQRVVAAALDGQENLSSLLSVDTGGDEAQTWLFTSAQNEAATVADRIAALLDADDQLVPSDFALLVRQTPDALEPTLSEEFAARGLIIRNESEKVGRTTLQDLLTEELTTLVVGMLRLSTLTRSPATWSSIGEVIRDILGVDPGDSVASRYVDESLDAFLIETRSWLASVGPEVNSAENLVDRVLDFVGRSHLRAAVPSYRSGDAFEIAEEAVRIRLGAATAAGDWSEVADHFLAANSVPMLTVHKSKGLEFKHVFFLGIDDKFWWAHSPGDSDGLSTFFVGLSRARLSVRFTYCAERATRSKVSDLFDVLSAAAVQELSFG